MGGEPSYRLWSAVSSLREQPQRYERAEVFLPHSET